MEKAVEESHNSQLQRAMDESTYSQSSIDQMYKQKALMMSDIEATDYQLEQAVLASSIEANKHSQTASSTSSSSTTAVATTAARASASLPSYHSPIQDAEYPDTVQELVMNGFELKKVVKAYELIGDNFDDLLSFLLSTNK